MSSVCVSSCLDDVREPVRRTYVSLNKWPESEAEFVRSSKGAKQEARVVDSMYCRQVYLRSYTFSRRESVQEKARKRLGRLRDKMVLIHRMRIGNSEGDGDGDEKMGRSCSCVVLRRAKEVSCAALLCVYRRLLFCIDRRRRY